MNKDELRIILEPVSATFETFRGLIYAGTLSVGAYGEFSTVKFQTHLVLSHSVDRTLPGHVGVKILPPHRLPPLHLLEEEKVSAYDHEMSVKYRLLCGFTGCA